MKNLKLNITLDESGRGFDEAQETIKNLESIHREICLGQLDEKAEDGIVSELLNAQNRENGFWYSLVDAEMPSDSRVDYIYVPTYYATAILMKSSLVQPKRLNDEKFADSIQRALNASVQRSFHGHGYDALRGFLDAIEIFRSASADLFVRQYAGFSEQFTELWRSVYGQLLDIVMFGDEQSWMLDKSTKERANKVLTQWMTEQVEHLHSSENHLYFAYGSNMNLQQMARRCPEAKWIGQAYLPNFALCFRESRSGFYASVDEYRGSWTPVIVWSINDRDVRELDCYEGYGKKECYDKKIVHACVGEMSLEGMIYYLPEHRPLGKPHQGYVDNMKASYTNWGFNNFLHNLPKEE